MFVFLSDISLELRLLMFVIIKLLALSDRKKGYLTGFYFPVEFLIFVSVLFCVVFFKQRINSAYVVI